MPISNINPIVTQLNQSQRRPRRPQHPFQLRHEAFQIQPFLCAPVLAGETIKKTNLQARVVTDPIKNPLIGWWLEHYLFYVKLTDLPGRDDFIDMLVTPGKDMSAYNKAADVATYHAGPGIDWVQECLEYIVGEFFRDKAAGELWDDYLIGGKPSAGLNTRNVWDSLVDDTTKLTGTAPIALETPEAHQESMDAYEFLRRLQMAGVNDLESYLATFGVRVDKERERIAETVRYSKDWTYPSNTIDPTDGSPSSACSWSAALSADKDRFFKEPGFVFGVTVCRPKMYLSGQKGLTVSAMNDAIAWLPAIMSDSVYTSLIEEAAASPLIPAATDGFWFDIRDLLLYGEQFLNFALTATDAGLCALPTAGLQKMYPSDADVDALWVTPLTQNLIRQDGIVSLNILGRQMDYTDST